MGITFVGRAPGSMLWLGEYAFLEKGSTGLATSLSTSSETEIEILDDDSIEISMPDLGASASGWIDLKDGTIDIEEDKDLLVVENAAETATRYLSAAGVRVSGLSIRTRNANGKDSNAKNIVNPRDGASSTVSVIGSILGALGADIEENGVLHKLSHISYAISTGIVGQGADIATSAFGSVVYKKHSDKFVEKFIDGYDNDELLESMVSRWDFEVERFEMPEAFKLIAGELAGSREELEKYCKKIFEFRSRESETYESMINEINSENLRAIGAMKLVKKGREAEKNLIAFRESFEKSRALIRDLAAKSGVQIEDDLSMKLLEESRKRGAYVAGLCSLENRKGIASLTTYGKSYESLKGFFSKVDEIIPIEVEIKNKGFSFEKKIAEGREERAHE